MCELIWDQLGKVLKKAGFGENTPCMCLKPYLKSVLFGKVLGILYISVTGRAAAAAAGESQGTCSL